MAFGIDDAIGAVANLASGIVGTIWPNATQVEKDKLAQFQAELTAKMAPILGQLDINKQEAASSSLFIAGWRPAIGWICATALAYQYVIVPVSMWASFAVGHPFPKPPTLDDTLWQLMFGMLGMGGLRTFEKMKGVASNH